MTLPTICAWCRLPLPNGLDRSICFKCLPPDQDEIESRKGDKWTIEKWRQEYRELLDQCDKHAIERNKLGDVLQKIALLGDTGSETHWKEFNTGPGQPIVNGWRVAERMRELALAAVGLGECETCQDEGQVQLTDEGGNRAWWPCPVCRPLAI